MSMEDHVIDLLPGFALGILDEKETEQVLEHLGECETCRVELSSYQAVSSSLGLAAPMVEPPAALKQKVITGVSQKFTSDLPPVYANSSSLAGSRFKKWIFSWQPLVSLLVLALFASNLLLWRQVVQLRSAPAQTDFGLVKMVGTGTETGASGVLVVSPNGQDGTLVVTGLTVLDANHQYQLWLIKDGQRISGGVFSVSEDKYGSLWIYSEKPLSSYAQFGVTIEPTGGSPGPTGEKVLGGSF